MDNIINYSCFACIFLSFVSTSVSFEHRMKITTNNVHITYSFHTSENGRETFAQTLDTSKFTVDSRKCATDNNNVCLEWANEAQFESKSLDNKCKQYVYNTVSGHDASVILNITGIHLYGGCSSRAEPWPVEKIPVYDRAFVSKEDNSEGVLESIWYTSDGMYVYVDSITPLFYSIYENKLQLNARNKTPYIRTGDKITLKYTICKFENIKLAYQHAIDNILGKPSAPPDYRMVEQPIWSTWVKFKKNINESVVLDFAQSINDHKLPNSQLEIDDMWETCYGSFTIDKNRFPNMKRLVSKLKQWGFRVTLWAHPFINVDCEPYFSQAKRRGYLVRNAKNEVITNWWNGDGAIIDFTNPKAADWWQTELYRVKAETGIDSYKLDAGESNYGPPPVIFHKMADDHPETNMKAYIATLAQFGDMVEVRVGRQTQRYPIFMRMNDRNTIWNGQIGMNTIIPMMLQLNLIGYPYVLPDMVGGNLYNQDTVDTEMFIRWLQINVFMPSFQFSITPWELGDEVTKMSKKYIDLHVKYAPKIYNLMKQATEKPIPVNPPIWWIDPTDNVTFTIDSEFLLGEDLLVAPVLEQGARSRDIYLPKGIWKDEEKGNQIKGPVWLKNYPADLKILPHFTLISDGGSYANALNPISLLIFSMACLLYLLRY